MLFTELKNIVSTEKEARKFGIQIGIVLILISVLMFILQKHSYYYSFAAGGGLILLGLIFPKALIHPNRIWMSLAVVLGFFSSRIILFILFYLILTPIGLIAKLSGKDFLDEKIDRTQKSYWNLRENKIYDKSQTEKQF